MVCSWKGNLSGLCGIVILFRFSFGSVFEKKTQIWFGMSLVRFGLKTLFSLDVVVLFTTYVILEYLIHSIYYSVTVLC